MALGFRDCCNSASYFYLNGIPATVSEFETYYITTSQGERFCATYLDVPSLNYQPPTYNLLEMTEYGSCNDCKTLNSYTCPTSESILISQVGAGSVAESDCRIVTIMPLYAECVSVNPTYELPNSGSVSLYVSGGTPPYFFFESGTANAIGNNDSGNNIFQIFQNLPEGTYNIDIVDSNRDFLITISCVLDAGPTDLTVSCIPTNLVIYGGNNGAINLNVNGGTPPYNYIYNDSYVSLPLTNLIAGTYTITVVDSGNGGDNQTQTISCTVFQPAPVDYPESLCMKFTLCGTVFLLQFERDVTDINLRASYICVNPQTFGLSSLSIYYGDNGWRTSSETVSSQPSFNGFCGVSLLGEIFAPTSVTSTATIPIGTWSRNGGALSTSSAVVVNSGNCALTGQFISSETYCSQTPNQLATVVLGAYGGTAPYIYYVLGTNISQSNTAPIFSLPGGSYTLLVQDSTGNGSDPVSFTVPTNAGTDVLFGINSCATGDVSVSIANQVNTSPQIVDGETQSVLALVTTTIDFSFLPDGAEFTGNLKFLLSSDYTSGSSNRKFPEDSNITVSPLFAINEMTTNGVTINLLDGVTPSYVSQNFPSFNGTNGTWYNYAQGNECCANPTQQGLKWSQYEYWDTQTLTFNSTTQLTLTIGILTSNSVRLLQGICSSSFCGAYLGNSFSVVLENLTATTGCLNVDGSKPLLSFSIQNNSDGTAGWDNPPRTC